MVAIAIAAVWAGVRVLVMALMLAGLRGIDDSLWMAARIDGIPTWRVYASIVLPMMGPTFGTAFVLLAVGVVKVFDVVVAMTLGGPGIASEVPAKFIIDNLFNRANIGMASAASTVLLMTVLILLAPWLYARGRGMRRDARAIRVASAAPAIAPRGDAQGAAITSPARPFLDRGSHRNVHSMEACFDECPGRLRRARRPGKGLGEESLAERRVRQRRKPGRIPRPARLGLYAFPLTAAVMFLLPLYVMLVTSIKPMAEIRLGNLFALPVNVTLEPWVQAWSSVCTGLQCEGIRGGFINSVSIVVPSTILSILFGAINGYALSFWRPRGAQSLFFVLLTGAFIPYQVMMYPLVRALAALGIFGSLSGIVLIHTIFGMPVMTLLFRNYYSSVPRELFMAARIDGGGFWRIFVQLMLPMSLPIVVVAMIMQVTAIWNDFVLGLVFAGSEHLPMTVQLNNVINTTTGERHYNVNMAATLLTSLVPLAVYLVSGRWFVRGIAAGAVKGLAS